MGIMQCAPTSHAQGTGLNVELGGGEGGGAGGCFLSDRPPENEILRALSGWNGWGRGTDGGINSGSGYANHHT